jgi:hypothetical protein
MSTNASETLFKKLNLIKNLKIYVIYFKNEHFLYFYSILKNNNI